MPNRRHPTRSKPIAPPRHRRLTPREIEVVKLIAAGLGTKEMADRLDITENTVESHRANVFRKLNLERATQLVRWAIEEGVA